MEMEAMLNQLFARKDPYVPEGADLQLPPETSPPSDAPEITQVNVPGDGTTHKGYVLQSGKLHLATALQDHAVLLLTTDDTFVHIGKDKRVVEKTNGQKIRHGMIMLEDSSPHVEKDSTAIFVFKDADHPQTVRPFTRIKDVMFYEPQTLGNPVRRSSSSDGESNMSTMLLRQFLK